MADFLNAGGFDDDGEMDTDGITDFLAGIPVIGGLLSGAAGAPPPAGAPMGTFSNFLGLAPVTNALSGSSSSSSSSAPSSSGPLGIVSNLLGGGGGGGIGGLLSSLPLPPMPPMPMLPGIGSLPLPPIPPVLIPALGQGIGQATGIVPASTGIGALLGAGMGGLPFGTGPFPGPLGDMMQRRFGQQALPPAWAVEPSSVTRGDWRDAADHAEKVGRAVVARVTGTTEPQLAEIRRWLRQRAAQIQATAEHRAVMSDSDFKSTVIEQLLQMRRQLGLAPSGGAPVLYNAAGGSASGSFSSKY